MFRTSMKERMVVFLLVFVALSVLWDEETILKSVSDASNMFGSEQSLVSPAALNQNEMKKASQENLKWLILQHMPLHGVRADGTRSDVHYRCKPLEIVRYGMYHKWGGPVVLRQPLSGTLLNRSGVLDGHVKISSFRLRILVLGNSLSEQLHNGLEEALCFLYSDPDH